MKGSMLIQNSLRKIIVIIIFCMICYAILEREAVGTEIGDVDLCVRKSGVNRIFFE